MRKHLVPLFVVLALLLTCTCSVFAHSGGTDENGGHYDYSTGEYHYHHGYSAHEHVDGECVFDFEDNIDHNRDDSSVGSSKNEKSPPIWAYILFGAVVSLLVIPGIITGLRECIREIKERPTKNNYIDLGMMILAILAGIVAPIIIAILCA